MSLDQLAKPDGGLAQVEVAGNELTLFDHTPPLIAAMRDDIAAAERRVWQESYTFANDAAGQTIAEALSERAKAGLDVQLMYDAVGSFSTPQALFDSLRTAGVQVHAFHTLRDALWRQRSLRMLNRRNHRKLLVVDDAVGYFGGMNVVDQSGTTTVEQARARLPVSSGWRDLHVRLCGPQQAELAASCQRMWQATHKRRAGVWPKWPVERMLRTREDGLYFFDCRPALRLRRPARVLAPLLRQAEKKITVAMAYFIPVGQVLRELLRARRRGVRVQVIVPGVSDVPAVQAATRHFYAQLLRRGIQIYERQDQMLHSKTMTIDGRWSVVGSCNLDPRSLRTNLEFLSVIRSAALAQEVERVCRYEVERSRRITAADVRGRSCLTRTWDRTCWSLRRWL